MRRHVPLIDGDEYDLFTGWKRFHRFGKGTKKRIKRAFNKRERRFLNNQTGE